MDSTNLKPEQAEKIYRSPFRLANYLIRLRERMHRVGFPPKDRLYRLVFEAQEKIQSLTTELHSLSLGPGGGRVRSQTQRDPTAESGDLEP
jgi:hypothetical protein